MADLIDFAELAAALLDRAPTLVPQWLPGGKRAGHEWICANLGGGEGRSLSVNLVTGRWADFGSEDKGGDLISLYAAIHGLNNGPAARQLMQDLGWQRAQPVQTPAPRHARDVAAVDDRPAPPADEASAPARRKSIWRPVVPVPAHAPEPDFKHFSRGAPERTWCYEFDGQRYGYVARFLTSDGGKEILPHTWCTDESDRRGTSRWHWMQWEEPRPLYVPAALLSGNPGDVPVVLVEGEKCAMAGHELLGHEFDFVSWPGGSKAYAKAAWGWLMGRTVYLWPDADAKRQRLSAEERAAGVDPQSKPLLPCGKQPGVAAMVAIGSLLVADHGCTVLMCPVPAPDAPGAMTDGWDIADAIQQGWDAAQVRAFIRGAHAFSPPDDAARAKARDPAAAVEAGRVEDERAWRVKLLTTEKGAIKACRENAVLALDGLAGEDGGPWLPGIAACAGVVAYNDFTNDVMKLRAAPWGSPAGLWEEVDELLMGEYLVREHWLPSMPRGTLEEAVRMVAYRHRYHPVRQYLQGLKWDRTRRLSTWLRRVCLEEDERDDRDPLQQYLARAGTWFLMGMCARVMTPGVKFDYMLILEGAQGLRKSTLLRVLAGDWFADTGLMLGDKDSYQQLQGRWLYEFAELDSFGKAEVTKIKSFIASSADYFRASFDKRARDYPRQLVFAGTTNEDHYLTDPTGNRRFWPLRVTRLIDIDWVMEHRDQLFAEAMARLSAGARMYPTPEEERELFEPQQRQRAVENAIEVAVARWLYDDVNGQLASEISLVDLLGKIGIGIEKLGPGRYHEKQAAAALRRLGWTEARSSKPGRPRVYKRPLAGASGAAGGSPSKGSTQDHDQTETADACPF
jgi:predicted P-loop ATPase